MTIVGAPDTRASTIFVTYSKEECEWKIMVIFRKAPLEESPGCTQDQVDSSWRIFKQFVKREIARTFEIPCTAPLHGLGCRVSLIPFFEDDDSTPGGLPLPPRRALEVRFHCNRPGLTRGGQGSPGFYNPRNSTLNLGVPDSQPDENLPRPDGMSAHVDLNTATPEEVARRTGYVFLHETLHAFGGAHPGLDLRDGWREGDLMNAVPRNWYLMQANAAREGRSIFIRYFSSPSAQNIAELLRYLKKKGALPKGVPSDCSETDCCFPVPGGRYSGPGGAGTPGPGPSGGRGGTTPSPGHGPSGPLAPPHLGPIPGVPTGSWGSRQQDRTSGKGKRIDGLESGVETYGASRSSGTTAEFIRSLVHSGSRSVSMRRSEVPNESAGAEDKCTDADEGSKNCNCCKA